MAQRSERFRRLARARRAGSHTGPRTGDLFEHFGIEIEPPSEPLAETTIVEAAPCRGCGWLVPYATDSASCPLCGLPEPLGA